MPNSILLTSPRWHVAMGLLGAGWLTACQAPVPAAALPAATCATPATVRDLSGLDGCGKVLELANGKRLEPSGAVWTAFSSANGQRVLISYEPVPNAVGICMAGQAARITCIQAAKP